MSILADIAYVAAIFIIVSVLVYAVAKEFEY